MPRPDRHSQAIRTRRNHKSASPSTAEGEWRDYAMDFGREKAVFSVFRRASEVPLYRIVKDPSLARKQGMYSVVAQTGLILKRGQDLATVLRVLAKTPKLSTI